MINKIFTGLIILVIFVITVATAQAETLISENYDSISNWLCTDAVPAGWTNKAACWSVNYNDEMHYCGEITPTEGRGNTLKLWRRNGVDSGYCGYLNRILTKSEFNQHHKEIDIRFKMKIPPQWDAILGAANTHKLNRLTTKTTYDGSATSTLYFDVKGSTFKSGKFSFYVTKEGPVRYTQKTISELGVNDDQWHSYEIHFKMNSATGVSDGELHFYIDSQEIAFCTPYAECHPSGLQKWDFKYSADEYLSDVISPGIGNLTDGHWNFPTDNPYAIEFDDFVVTTTPAAKLSAPTDLHMLAIPGAN